mmetsp:Transcript_13582/g.29535  ORF Transcript_13582/g.29535 Transcript_13582/m.29535 type:complete len:387 (+) Transcript_13582:66-1226(+)
MLERLRFSIPISIAINAPVELVWDALTDIRSYPSTLASVLEVKPIEDRYSNYRSSATTSSVASRASANSLKSSSSIQSQASNSQSNNTNNSNSQAHSNIGSQSSSTSTPSPSAPIERAVSLMGSKWKITRISVLENQSYSASVAITQYSEEEDKRSFTMSTHQMLGATSSLKLIVEPASVPVLDLSSRSSRRDGHKIGDETRSTSDSATSTPRNHPQSSSLQQPQQLPNNSTNTNDATSKSACQVTAIITMIPYQFFVKLLGIMCCLCLLKYRARMAMECDLEDLTVYCEGKVLAAEAAASSKAEEGRRRQDDGQILDDRIQSGTSDEEGDERKCEERQQALEDEADAAGGGNSLSSAESGRNKNNLRTIVEEDCLASSQKSLCSS